MREGEKDVEKILTIAIPCYNSQDYVKRALESVIHADPQIEVLVVDDGSTDGTADIAKEYERQFPDVVRYYHKENGGHGDAVVTGFHQARGVYYKVLDSDDWLNTKALRRIVSFLKAEYGQGKTYDLVIGNYVYEKVGARHKKEISYGHVLPVEREFTWKEIGTFALGQYILMHSVIYRTELLLSCNLELPKHTYYVDNLFVYYPLPFVKNIYYFDTDLYHYFIGREDQSVNENRLLERIDQQERVAYTMYGMHELCEIEEPRLRYYMSQYTVIMAAICSALYVMKGTDEALQKKRDFWETVRTRYAGQYEYMRRQWLARATMKDGPLWNRIIRIGYAIAKRIYHFN